ncbi:hypothetical protein GCM10017752_67090 [Streptomyces roseoviridis]
MATAATAPPRRMGFFVKASSERTAAGGVSNVWPPPASRKPRRPGATRSLHRLPRTAASDRVSRERRTPPAARAAARPRRGGTRRRELGGNAGARSYVWQAENERGRPAPTV